MGIPEREKKLSKKQRLQVKNISFQDKKGSCVDSAEWIKHSHQDTSVWISEHQKTQENLLKNCKTIGHKIYRNLLFSCIFGNKQSRRQNWGKTPNYNNSKKKYLRINFWWYNYIKK